MNPKLSVIIPVYNVKDYLEQCICSVIHQDYDNFEVILVDDGANDGSEELCDEFARKDSRIIVIHQANQGHTAARQAGYEKSDGDYILFMDSDDWVDLGMFRTMMEKCVDNSIDIVQCSYRSVKNGKKREESPVFDEGLYDKERLANQIYPKMIYEGSFYKFGIAPNIWNKIFRRKLIGESLYRIDRRIRSGEDGLLTYHCFLKAEMVWILNDCFYNYRSRKLSMCRITNSRLEENHILFQYYSDWFCDNGYLTEQIYRYVVYQTLQAMEVALKKTGIRQITKAHPYLIKGSLESESIKNVKVSEVKGKRNKLTLIRLKIRE